VTVCYLEIDDEITTAIARLRGVTDGEAVMIVPPGSRIATSRINFKLLAREANERRLNVAAVSDDPAVRALAISAGLPTYDSLPAAEAALATFREQDRALAERLGRSPDEVPPAWSSTRTAQVATLPSPLVDAPPVEGRAGGEGRARPGPSIGDTQVLPVEPQPQPEPQPAAARRRARRVPVAPALVVGLLVVLVAAVAYGAYVFLPTATITIVPATSILRLDAFTVRADPGVAVVDPAAGSLPAQPIDLPLHVSGTFDATGVDVHETRATGEVRFRSENTLGSVAIPEGTVVATAEGIEFATTEAATVPKAVLLVAPGTVDVRIRAVRSGPRGNVAADTITDLPGSLRSKLVSVRNRQPTEGGRRTEDDVVTQADYDSALATLGEQLESALVAALADPASIPRGLTAYAQTASHGEGLADQPADAVVGTVAPTFDLALDADGQVLAVNEGLIDEIAQSRLDDALAQGQQMVEDRQTITHDSGQVAGDVISYEVSASALIFNTPDSQALLAQVRGKTVVEAKAILADYGMVDIVMWPDFVDRLPEQISRISLTIAPPAAGS
jgi:hypothetical protein